MLGPKSWVLSAALGLKDRKVELCELSEAEKTTPHHSCAASKALSRDFRVSKVFTRPCGPALIVMWRSCKVLFLDLKGKYSVMHYSKRLEH